MKVYAVIKTDEGLVLKSWPSKKSFEREERWCDPKFIRVITTADLESYEFPIETGFIVYSDDAIAAHGMLRDVYLNRR